MLKLIVMKKNYILSILLGMALILSCSKENIEDNLSRNWEITTVDNDDGSNNNGGNNDPLDDLLYKKTLWAGQNIFVGNGIVVLLNSDNTIEVTYNTDGDWEILETHLYIGPYADVPLNGANNPKIGQFPYAQVHPAGTTTVTYNGPELSTAQDVVGCFIVAAHAVVRNTVTDEEETAWLEGTSFPGNSWAMYAQICL
jgi:hypothetical protein